jgi:hypothetical protein
MWFQRAFWFGAGTVTGVLVSQLVMRPEGRALLKRALGGGMALRDLVVQPIERFREDLSDLVAEAREDYEAGVARSESTEDSVGQQA